MSLRPGDRNPLVPHRNPLVHSIAGGIVDHESTDRAASSDVTRFESRRGHQCCFNTVALLLLITRSAVRARPGEPFIFFSLRPPSSVPGTDHKTDSHRVGHIAAGAIQEVRSSPSRRPIYGHPWAIVCQINLRLTHNPCLLRNATSRSP
jgi:hypothetical protein